MKKHLILRSASVRRDIGGWYDEFFDALRGYLFHCLHSSHDAEDIAHEAFLHLWLARSSGPIYNPKAFLFTTATNLLKDLYRRAHTRAMRTRVPVEDVEIPDLSSDPASILESGQTLALIARTLEQLRPSTRKAFLLDRVELCSHSKIAARMGVTVSMVEKHISNAMTAFEATGFEQPRHAGSRRTGRRNGHRRFNSQPNGRTIRHSGLQVAPNSLGAMA